MIDQSFSTSVTLIDSIRWVCLVFEIKEVADREVGLGGYGLSGGLTEFLSITL